MKHARQKFILVLVNLIHLDQTSQDWHDYKWVKASGQIGSLVLDGDMVVIHI